MAALPAMTKSLGLGPATIEWTVNAYLLASAVFIVLGGEAADRFGARRSSAAGVALFALASMRFDGMSGRRDHQKRPGDERDTATFNTHV
jgi:MFS family permease